MTLRVGDDGVVFALSDAMKHSFVSNDSCFYLDVTDSIVDECIQKLVCHKPLRSH